MNFIFISPQFPTNYYHFCAELKNNGVNVLGIGDSAYDSLPYSLKNVLTEYYKVESDRKSTRLNSSHRCTSRMPSSA